MKYLADNIKYLRKKLGLSQEKLADLLGLNRGNIASYEKGSAEPRIENLIKMMQVFKVEVKDLVEKDLAGIEKLDQEISSLKENESYSDFLVKWEKGRLLKRLVNRDERIQQFVKQSEEMHKILEGFKLFHKYKMENGRTVSEDVKKIADDYEKLLEVMEVMLQTDRQMIEYLEEKEIEIPGKK
jgi:transcriptional regulator with XRE-family HTH domain